MLYPRFILFFLKSGGDVSLFCQKEKGSYICTVMTEEKNTVSTLCYKGGKECYSHAVLTGKISVLCSHCVLGEKKVTVLTLRGGCYVQARILCPGFL